MAENFQIRDVFNERVVNSLSDRIKNAWKKFDKINFRHEINPALPELTYSERLKHISHILEKYLPENFPDAVSILLKAQLPPYENDELGNVYDRFITVPQTSFVSRCGLAYYDISIHALYEMTQRFSAEWDIRPFIIAYPEKTMGILKQWAKDKNPHVRRLVSEGSRPFLPWGKRLNQFVKDPYPTLELLELLKNDPSEYVRRSVANHFNDHAKNHPDLVVDTLKRWAKEIPNNKDLERQIKHATRTLVKNGHPGALELIGFKRGAKAKVENLKSDKKIKIGDHLNFSFNVVGHAKKPEKLAIDYVVYFNKANGTLAPKVFKMTTKEIKPNESINLKKRHSFKIITTRVYYPGKHALAIQVNGEEKAKTNFELTK